MTQAEQRDDPVASYLETRLGLSFTGPRRERLLASVDAQQRSAGLSPQEFLDSISRPGKEFDRLVAEVTVGETSFFRDRAQCRLLRELVLPQVSAGSRSTPVAMWSAGCASGEEAFTLAALADAAGLRDGYLVVGSDASRRSIAKADNAVYGQWSMRSTTDREKRAYFQELEGQWQVSERLRRRTRFVQRNLLDGPPPPGRFDVILCRNLLIYLTREAVQRVTEVLVGALAPQGWLVTGAADPPLDAPGLETARTAYGLVYRRVEGRLRPEAETAERAGPPARRQGAARRPLTSRREHVAGPRSAGRAPRAEVGTPPAHQLAEQVRSLGDAGRLDEACRAAATAATAHPLDVGLRYLAGVVLLEAGRLDEAAAAAAAAVYLGPDLPAAHLLLGQVEHARGNTDRARRSFRNGSRLLAPMADDAAVALAGDVPAGHLAAVAARYLSSHDGVR